MTTLLSKRVTCTLKKILFFSPFVTFLNPFVHTNGILWNWTAYIKKQTIWQVHRFYFVIVQNRSICLHKKKTYYRQRWFLSHASCLMLSECWVLSAVYAAQHSKPQYFIAIATKYYTLLVFGGWSILTILLSVLELSNHISSQIL